MNNILQEKLNKYKMYYNSSYQYKDYDISDYYKSRIKELKLKINKIKINQEFDKWMEKLINKNGTTNY